jgi:toxin-antitoxin system PIN domain toxin
MIAVDTNILVFAHRKDSPFHIKANEIVTEFAEGSKPWSIPWSCIHEFFSIVTHPRIYNPPTPYPKALDQISAWMESPSLILISEAHGYWEVLKDLVDTSHTKGPMIHDARIAATCILNGISELFSADRDFGRFHRLKVHNPLVA